MLDHFRHLLVESPELQKYNLHGGLATWLLQDTQKVFQLGTAARDAWQRNDIQTARGQIIALMDYLDGEELAAKELPAGTALAAAENDVRIPLQGRDPKNDAYTYGNDIPVGYVYLISLHLSGALSSSRTTQDQRQLATRIDTALNEMDHELTLVHDKAKILAYLDDAVLAQSTSLATLNDIVTAAQTAYTGHIDQPSGQSQGGAIWVYTNIQRLVQFTITPYSGS